MTQRGDDKITGMLRAAGLPVKPSYSRREVCAILDISPRTFWRMVAHYEPDPKSDGPIHPAMLDSYMTRGHHRVRHQELADYLRRNRTWERRNAIDPRQAELFDPVP